MSQENFATILGECLTICAKPPEEGWRRTNGLQLPLHKFQILTWILFPIVLAHFYGFLRPLIWFPESLGVALVVTFTLSSFSALVFGYWTCSINPVDDNLLSVSVPGNEIPHLETVFCYICEANVDKSSKHCRYCGKCITRFDHHCKWLNTCVGAKNYTFFLVAVFSIGLLTSISLGLSIAFLIESFAFEHQILCRLSDSDSASVLNGSSLKGISVVSVVILLPLVGLVYQLLGFHCMLLWNGITTYEFIIFEQKRQREKLQAETVQRMNRQVPMKSQRRPDDYPSGENTKDSEIEMAMNERERRREHENGQSTDRVLVVM